MISTTFDTLQASKDLQENGFKREQAEAVAQAIRNGQGELATKSDIAELKADINGLRWTFSILISAMFVVMIGGFGLMATFLNSLNNIPN